MNDLQIFESSEFGQIRVIEVDDEPYFVGKDVAEVLGYSNPRKAISDHVDDEDRTDGVTIRDSIGREQTPILINESGLYNLILSSKLPTAKKFKRWVTTEVLPTIRKHGAYMTEDTIDMMIASPEFGIKLLTSLKEEQARRKSLEIENAQQKQIIAELNPKASYYDMVLQCKDAVSPSKIAKDYGKSAIWLNRKLNEMGVQYKQGNMWLLYQKYAAGGYTQSKVDSFVRSDGVVATSMRTCWTQKGRLFIYELLKKEGILPLIEMTRE